MQRSGGILRALVRARRCNISHIAQDGSLASSRSFHVCKFSMRKENVFQHRCPQLFMQQISHIRLYSTADYPEHVMVDLPALSPTMDVGTIVRWEKQVGDKLNEGDLLCEIETDKATMGFETPEEGYLAKVFVAEGTRDIPVNRALCIITENEADIAAFSDFPDPGLSTPSSAPAAEPDISPEPTAVPTTPPPPPRPPVVTPPPAEVAAPPAGQAPTSPAVKGERIFASPLAKKLAADKGIDLQAVTGSGPRGRIRKQDIDAFVPSAAGAVPVIQPGGGPVAVTGPYIDVPIDQYRQELAQRAVYSKQTVPHYFLTVDIEADNLLDLAAELNKEVEGDEDVIELSHFVIKAASLACHKVPAANSSWMGDKIRQFVHVDVNYIMQSEKGQVGPVIYGADTKGLATISREIISLENRLAENTLQPHEYQGGTFTVTDLSSFGVKNCGSIITPPQACSLAIGALRESFVPDDDSEEGYRAANIFSATLACDHRVVDGAVGALWLQHFKGFLSRPHTMLL